MIIWLRNQNKIRYRTFQLNVELLHLLQGLLEARNVLDAAAGVEEGIEQDIVRVFALHVDVLLDKLNAALDLRLVQICKNMLSQESQKMCLECSVAIKCELLKNFKNLKFENSKFKHLNC